MNEQELIEIEKKIVELNCKCDILFALLITTLAFIICYVGLKAYNYEISKHDKEH